jgi:hypothetical protein
MAATIAKATGIDRQREKYTHRLGSEAAETTAATCQTFARAYVSRDGSGSVTVTRHGEVIHRFDFGPE